MMGGATFEDDIAEEIMKGCPEVDYVHCGDADETLRSDPTFVQRAIYGGHAGHDVARWGSRRLCRARPNLADMNKTPVPNFDEYFYARKRWLSLLR